MGTKSGAPVMDTPNETIFLIENAYFITIFLPFEM